PVLGSRSLKAFPPMWERRSMMTTRRPSSVAARSATVKPKKPAPTTSRSGVVTTTSAFAHLLDRVRDRPVEDQMPLLQEDAAVRDALHGIEIVGHDDESLALILHVCDPGQTLLLEGLVADCQHLVHQEDVELGVDCDRKGEPHEHPGGVVLNLRVDEVPHSAALDDLVEPGFGL